MILALLLACAGASKLDSTPLVQDTGENLTIDGPEGHTYTHFDGVATWEFGWDEDPDVRGCDLRWDLSGTATEPCTECAWAFEVTYTLDATSSTDEGDCFDGMDSTDFTWTVGLDVDYYGYGVPVLWYYNVDYGWEGLWAATWQYPALYWNSGYNERPYERGDTLYYYTAYWETSATVY